MCIHCIYWKSHIQMRMGAVDCCIGFHPVPIHNYQLLLLPPWSSPRFSPLPLFFCFWSEIKSVIQQNNFEIIWNGVSFLSVSFFLSPALLSPLPAGPGQLICFRSQLCVQSTVCSQQGVWKPAFVFTIPLWTVCACLCVATVKLK